MEAEKLHCSSIKVATIIDRSQTKLPQSAANVSGVKLRIFGKTTPMEAEIACCSSSKVAFITARSLTGINRLSKECVQGTDSLQSALYYFPTQGKPLNHSTITILKRKISEL
jgi:hypothetical protein